MRWLMFMLMIFFDLARCVFRSIVSGFKRIFVGCASNRSHRWQSCNARRHCWMCPNSLRIVVCRPPLGARCVLVHMRPGWEPQKLGGREGLFRHCGGEFPIRVGVGHFFPCGVVLVTFSVTVSVGATEGASLNMNRRA